MSDDVIAGVWQFVDTNILIYAYDVTQGAKHERARKLMGQLWEDEKGCLSIQVLQEFYVIATRKIAHPIPSEAAEQIIADVSNLKVHLPAPDDVLEAIRLHQRYQIAFWDAMVIHSAAQLGCDVVWSEDLNADQVYDGVRVLNPFAS